MTILIDFTHPLDNYEIISDATERAAGKSHGVISFQNTINKCKHYFFAFLNPQENGACFVSVKLPMTFSLKHFKQFHVNAVNLQQHSATYQLIVETRHSVEHNYTYQASFTPLHHETNIALKLSEFIPVFRGQRVHGEPALDTQWVTSIGLRIIGRVSDDPSKYQSGLYGLILYNISIE